MAAVIFPRRVVDRPAWVGLSSGLQRLWSAMTGSPTPMGGTAAAVVDTVALRDLITDHADAMFHVALSVVRDRDLAEDVTQDAMVKAWLAIGSFRGDAPLRHWLLRITRNAAISALRRRREELRDPQMLPENLSSSDVGRDVENRMSMTAFEAALSEVDELSRSIVVLRELEGLSYEAIADITGVSLATVKTRLMRARRVLASALEDWAP